MNSRTKGIIAGTAGIALLAGGATFATWSDSAVAAGGTIESGKLAVAITNAPQWFDVSADRTDGTATTEVTRLAGHPIAPASWKMVPGDTAEATFAFDVQVEGDNLAARLKLTGVESLDVNGGWATYKVYQADADAPSGYRDVTSSLADDTLLLVGPDAGAGLSGSHVVVDGGSAADLYVVVTVGFDGSGAQAQESTVTTLDDVAVSLTQVRGQAVTGF